MNVIDQVNLCTLLMKRLEEAVKDREIIIRGGKAPWGGYDFPISSGSGKYQIKADITRLRRELQRLSEAVMK